MRLLLLIGLLASPALWAEGVAHYQDERYGYVAANLAHFNLEYDTATAQELTPTGFNVRLGGMVDTHFGVEMRLGTGPSPDTFRPQSGAVNKIDYSVDHVAALLLTARLPVASPLELPGVENFFVQGFAGVADVGVKSDRFVCSAGDCNNTASHRDQTDLAYGLGLGVRTTQNVGLTLEYMHYSDKYNLEVTSLEGGLEWYF